MGTLLIADLHLEPERPALLHAFENLISGPARQAERLFILGDLFEAWVGDDDDSELAARVAAALSRLSQHGVPIAFQHGNRDFLLAADYAARCDMRFLPEAVIEVIAGRPTLLLHGDSLCTADLEYLKFRAQVRDQGWQRQFLSRPLAERRAFATNARAQSLRHTAGVAAELTDVAPEAVRDILRAHQVSLLVHGHTHRPAVHAFDLDGTQTTRCVLPDWRDQAAGVWIDAEGIRFEVFD